MIYSEGTIAGISTPVGEGAIGIVRMSGEDSKKIIGEIFVPTNKKDPREWTDRVLYLGEIVDPSKGDRVDEVLVSMFSAPYSYTREDMVEINCHGGHMALQRVLQLIVDNGARIAKPGEFTLRAFLSGRIDLVQAQAVMDIISARTDRALIMAKNQLSGATSDVISDIRGRLLNIMAHVEANIDFPEDDIPEADPDHIMSEIRQCRQEVSNLLQHSKAGKIVREGLSTLILGNTNVGKSSLLNALLQEDRAIVTDVPGTTRDVLEEYLNIGGIPMRIMDTAGIRKTEDTVEQIGILRAKEYIERAELVLIIFDAARDLTDDDRSIVELVEGKMAIGVLNKVDLPQRVYTEDIRELMPKDPVIAVSALKDEGIEDLRDALYRLAAQNLGLGEGSIMASERQCEALESAENILTRALSSLKNHRPIEVVEVDLRDAWENLGKILGETVGEDIVEGIFANFCIGK